MPALITDVGLALPLTLLAKGALLLLVAELAARLLRRRGAAARHLLWTAALAVLLALPLLSGVLPPLNLGLLDAGPAAGSHGVSARPTQGHGAPPPVVAPSDARIPSSVADGGAGVPADGGLAAALPEPATGLLLLWGLGTLALLGRMAVGIRAGARLLRRGRSLDDDWTRRADRIAGDLGLRRTPELIRSGDVDIPMVWGLLRPRVLLPEAAAAWPAERRDLVLTHELAHVKRGDCLAHLVGQLAHALHWPNPMAWRALERMRVEREVACDELVLAAGASGPDYARLLLDIARGAAGRDPVTGAAVAMARPSQLEGRLLSILNATGAPLGLPRRLRLAVPLALLVLAAPLAALQPWAAATEPAPAPAQGPTASADEPVEADRDVRVAEEAADAETTTAPAPEASPQAPDEETPAAGTEEEGQEPDQADAGVGARVMQAMLRTLQDPDAGMRREAAAALGRIESEAAVEGLLTALDDPEPTVRRQAAWALGMIESPEAVDGLTARLADDDVGTRSQAAWALGMIESPAATAALVAALDDPEPTVASQAAWALGMIESPDAVPGLLRALDAPDANLRSQVLWALGMIEDPAAVTGISRQLAADDPAVRGQAAWALGMIESPEAVDVLAGALRDPSPQVREKVVWALGMIGDEGAAEALLDVMETDEDEGIRRAAMQALSRVLG